VFFLSGECREPLSLFLALGTQFGAVIGLIVMEHAPGSVQPFAHDRDQRRQLGFAPGQETLIKGAQRGIMLGGNQRRHVQRGAQIERLPALLMRACCSTEEPETWCLGSSPLCATHCRFKTPLASSAG